MTNIHHATVAGAFYPAVPDELTLLIKEYLGKANPPEIKNLKALIVPHAGYIYSGEIAAYGYKILSRLNQKKKWKIMLLGPSHHACFKGASIGDFDYFQTPLGDIKVSTKVKNFLKEKQFDFIDEANPGEHCIEVELPFLQIVLKDFEIIPILIGDADNELLAKSIEKHLDSDTIIVVSSDLSHYHSYEEAKETDSFTIEAIKNLDLNRLKKGEACGQNAIETLLYIAHSKNWKTKLLDARNSGDTAGDKNAVVGYSAFAFYK